MAMQEQIYHGAMPLKLAEEEFVDAPVGALDTGSVRWLVAYPGWKGGLSSVGVTRGDAYPGASGMFVREVRVVGMGSEAEADVQLEGILAGNGDKKLRSISAFGSIVSIGPIEKVILVDDGDGDDPDGGTATAKRRVPKVDSSGDVVYKTIGTPTGSADRWNINDPGVTVVDTYFATTAPNYAHIGTALTPETAPTVRAYQWGSYNEPMRANHPNGWVLADRQGDQLYGDLGATGLYRVVDTYEYYYAAVPD